MLRARIRAAYRAAPERTVLIGVMAVLLGLSAVALIGSFVAAVTGSTVLSALIACAILATEFRTILAIFILALGKLWDLFSAIGFFASLSEAATALGERLLGLDPTDRPIEGTT